MDLNEPIESLPHTSSTTVNRLKSLNINTFWDLFNYFPFRYEDFHVISAIGSAQEGETVTVVGTIKESKFAVTRSGLKLQTFIIEDQTGTIEASWYNQPYLLTLLKKGQRISVAGEIKRYGRKLSIIPKEYEILSYDVSIHHIVNYLKHTGRLIPVYPETRGLSSKTIREKIFFLLQSFTDEKIAYQNIHFPKNNELATVAKKRLSFDELFLTQLSSRLVKKEWDKETTGHQFDIGKFNTIIGDFIEKLPFKLTEAQKRVIGEIGEDMAKTKPMNRILQGEVGSGKTIVAAIAVYLTFLNGFKTLIMTPTEILAEQHHKTISHLFYNFPARNASHSDAGGQLPKILLITSSHKPTERELQNADIIIGTHALIQKKLNFKRVGLVIVDEQHRFGVSQRKELKNKGLNPHLLTMTATPIPRTVMLTIYGELDLSALDEMPKDRKTVKTFIVPQEKRQAGYDWIQKQIIKDKIQAFILCPLIDESDHETLQSIKAAKKEFLSLQKIFPKLRLGLLHGRCKSKEKQKIMQDFYNRKYDILVTTPVVELGIDISNATIMVIEGAERFGLAQLHQLRGRVGRGDKQSYCLVFSSDRQKVNDQRLEYFSTHNNGADLAEKDLEIRGPGNIFGISQHGYVDLKIANLSDHNLIEQTKKAVDYFTARCRLDDFPNLKNRFEKYCNLQISQD